MTSSTLVYALLAGILPSFIWLYFWVREDRLHPEPRTLLAACFLAGGLAVVAAIFAEQYVGGLITSTAWKYTAWAAIEEVFKFIAVAIVALPALANDEPIDALIYCITVALGFAALENTIFIMGPLSSGAVASAIMTDSMRFMGATLVHTVCSGVIGFGIGLMFYRSLASKVVAASIGIAIASALHASFNLSIINGGPTDTLRSFAWVWGATVILIILFEEIKAVRSKLT